MPTTIASDDFNRADGALGADWAVGVGAFEIASNAARTNSNADGYAYWAGAGTFDDDQYSQVVLAAAASGNPGSDNWGGLCVRGGGDGAYVLEVSSTIWYLARLTSGGTFTNLTNGSLTMAAGDTVYLEIVGTTLIGKHNGTQFTTTTDSTYSTGKPGLSGYKVASGTTEDSWEGGDVGTPAAATTGFLTPMRGTW